MGPAEPVAIRAASPDEVDALGAIGARSWRGTYPGIVPDAVRDEWVPCPIVRFRGALEPPAAR
jgi:hypothetical protein